MGVIDAIVARNRTIPTVKKSLRERLSRNNGEVEWSPDLLRIMALPRRLKPDLEPIVKDLTARLKRPEGTQTLRPIQAWMLWEAVLVGGLVAQVVVGGGKTLPGMLLPMVMPECKRAVLLIPSDLRPQFHADWAEYGKHWKLPNLADSRGPWFEDRPVLHVHTYSEISTKGNTALLKHIDPDLVMGDELQCVKNFDSSRGWRFFDHFINHEKARLAGWTGSLTADTIADFAHFFAIALMNGSPVPIDPKTVKEWAAALDPDDNERLSPGALLQFCLPGEDVRSGVGRRMVDTIGFVSSGDNELTTKLVMRQRQPPPMPEEVKKPYRKLKVKDPVTNCWMRPDGELLEDQLQVVACARQLSMGLYLRWIFPRGEPKELIDLWFEVRTLWNRELRTFLAESRRTHLDSPALCEDAAKRYYDGGCDECQRLPEAQHADGCSLAKTHPLWNPFSYPAWREIENTVYHETQAVWLSDWLMQDVAAWAKEHTGIIWVEHPEVGQRLAAITGLKYYGEGDEAHEEIITETGARSIIASIDAHHRGINLQKQFSKMLLVAPPSSNTLIEQAIGRAHRPGQLEASVQVWYYAHTIELEHSLEEAIERAHYVQEMMKTPQKLCYCDWVKVGA